MHLYSFEKLEVWKEAIKLATNVYNYTKGFPNEEKFGLISEENYKNIRFEVESITNKVNALRNHFLKT